MRAFAILAIVVLALLAFVSASPIGVRGYEEVEDFVEEKPPCTTTAEVLEFTEGTPYVEASLEETPAVEDFTEETSAVEDFSDEVTPLETPSEVLDFDEDGTPDCEEEAVESFLEEPIPTETIEPSEVLDFVETVGVNADEPGYEGADAGYLGEATSEEKSTVPVLAIVGAVVGSVALVAVAGVAAWKIRSKKVAPTA